MFEEAKLLGEDLDGEVREGEERSERAGENLGGVLMFWWVRLRLGVKGIG